MLTIVKKNDSYDTITYQLENEDNSPIDLTGASVNFVMGKKNKLITNATATITSATSGIVSYQLTQLDTLVSGTFLAEFVVTFASGTKKTYPSNGYITVDIEQNLDTSQTNIVVDMIAEQQGDFTSKLNSILLQAGNINMSAMNEYTWTVTAGQLVFVFPSSAHYSSSAKWFQVLVGNVPVDNSLINRSYTNQFALNIDSSNIKAGMIVRAMWVEPIVPVSGGHHTTHEINGQDEINIANLRNYQELVATPLADKATKISPLRSPFNVIGNANYYNSVDGKWYVDSAKTIISNDDTAGITAFLSYMATNYPNTPILFPRLSYWITSTTIIPDKAKFIDFNNSVFNYTGAIGTYCISSGSNDGQTGGYVSANWKNLNIYCGESKTRHGMNVMMLRSSYFENIYIYGADTGIQMGMSFSNTFQFCTTNFCKTGIITGDNSNMVTFSQLSVLSCDVGVKLGSVSAATCYGVVFDNECGFQLCGTAFELNMIQQASIINSYFEANTLVFKVNSISNVDYGIYNFAVENNIIDVGLSTATNLMLVGDSARLLSAKFTGNRFMGTLTGTFFDRVSGLSNYGNWQRLIFKNNTFSIAKTFSNIFPSTFHVDKVETDIPIKIVVDSAQWSAVQSVEIACLGNSTFELSGVISRKSGGTATTIATGLPYWSTSETVKFEYLVMQTPTGAVGVKKTARIEIATNQSVMIYTDDNTDLNNIYLTGVRWCTRA